MNNEQERLASTKPRCSLPGCQQYATDNGYCGRHIASTNCKIKETLDFLTLTLQFDLERASKMKSKSIRSEVMHLKILYDSAKWISNKLQSTEKGNDKSSMEVERLDSLSVDESLLQIPNTMRKDSRVEIFIMDKKCTFCDNQTRVCIIVKGFPIKLCWECAGILKGLIKDKEVEQK